MPIELEQGWRLPLWVKSPIVTVGQSLPVYPDQRTFSESVGMSQKCQEKCQEETSRTACASNAIVAKRACADLTQ
jgi:hypothetical protein